LIPCFSSDFLYTYQKIKTKQTDTPEEVISRVGKIDFKNKKDGYRRIVPNSPSYWHIHRCRAVPYQPTKPALVSRPHWFTGGFFYFKTFVKI